MSYRTILIHVDDAPGADARIGYAARLATAHGAHLVGVVQTGIQRFLYGIPPDGYIGDLTPLFEDLGARARERAARFSDLAAAAGVASFEHRIGDEEPGYALARQAMLADLVVLGQANPADPASAHAGIPDTVTLHAPCPVLVLPHAGVPATDPTRVLVAWNASPEAARAVKQALPLLVRARAVDVVVCASDAGTEPAPDGQDLAHFLARHGATVTVQRTHADHAVAVADALLARVAHAGADLLVMGCYGHSRLRETLLGGVSRAVLAGMTVPTLMAH